MRCPAISLCSVAVHLHLSRSMHTQKISHDERTILRDGCEAKTQKYLSSVTHDLSISFASHVLHTLILQQDEILPISLFDFLIWPPFHFSPFFYRAATQLKRIVMSKPVCPRHDRSANRPSCQHKVKSDCGTSPLQADYDSHSTYCTS
jgi:hypothetical protein